VEEGWGGSYSVYFGGEPNSAALHPNTENSTRPLSYLEGNLAATSNLSIPSLTPYSTLLLFHILLTSKRFHELLPLYIPKIGLPRNRPLTEIDTLGLLAASQSSQSSGVVGLQDLQDSGQIVQQVTRDKRVWSPGGRHLHDLTCDG